jgi:transmembrane sensor
MAIAAASIAVIVCLWSAARLLQWRSSNRAIYETDVGQRLDVQLSDNSTIRLNTKSRVDVRFTSMGREVSLIKGEALFTVTHDRLRTFRVRIGQVVIQDLGTQFNVRVRAGQATVSVSDGRVSVMSVKDFQQPDGSKSPGLVRGAVDAGTYPRVELAQGDEAVIPTDGRTKWLRASRLPPEQLSARLSWTRGVVTFTGQSLAEAVEEINRYNRLRIEVVDPRLMTIRLGGIFNPTSPLTFVAALKRLGVKSDASTVNQEHSRVVHLTASASGTGSD